MVEPPCREIEFRRDYTPGEALQYYLPYLRLIYGKVNWINIPLKETKLNFTLNCYGLIRFGF